MSYVLQEETQEYLEEAKLKELVEKYSEFINFPIYLYASKDVDVPADEAADAEAGESEVSDEDEEVADDEDVEDGESSVRASVQLYHLREILSLLLSCVKSSKLFCRVLRRVYVCHDPYNKAYITLAKVC